MTPMALADGDLPDDKTVIRTHYAITEIGDLNRDNIISAADALLLLRYTVGLGQYLPFAIPSSETGVEDPAFYADANGDGQVDASDALYILRVTVGLTDGPYIMDYDILEHDQFSSAITGEYHYYSPDSQHYKSDSIALLTSTEGAPEGYDEAFFKTHDLICFRTFTDGTTVPAVGQVAYTNGYVYLRYWDEAAEMDAGSVYVAVTIPKGLADGKKLTAVRAESLVPQNTAFYYLEDELCGDLLNPTVFWANSRESLHTMARELDELHTIIPDIGEWLNIRDTDQYFNEYVLVMRVEDSETCQHMSDHELSRIEIEDDTAIIYLKYVGWDHTEPDVYGATTAYALDVPKAEVEGCTNIELRIEY